jgi:MFS family permease
MCIGSWCSPVTQLWLLIIGTIGFDLGVQMTLVAHQTIVYGIDPGARSRLNAVLFVGMFIGMAIGASAGSILLAQWGWIAVTGMATLTSLAAFALRLKTTHVKQIIAQYSDADARVVCG